MCFNLKLKKRVEFSRNFQFIIHRNYTGQLSRNFLVVSFKKKHAWKEEQQAPRRVIVNPAMPSNKIRANRCKWGGRKRGGKSWATVSVHLLNHAVVFEHGGPRSAHGEINKPATTTLADAQCRAICLAGFVYLALINFNNGATCESLDDKAFSATWLALGQWREPLSQI